MIGSSRLGAYSCVLSEHKEPSPVFTASLFVIAIGSPVRANIIFAVRHKDSSYICNLSLQRFSTGNADREDKNYCISG